MSSTNNKNKIAGIGIISVIIVMLSSVFIYVNVVKPQKYSEYMDLGNKYLLEENYEEAILAFEKAIKIDAKSTEARVGAAKGCIGINNIDSAADHLRNAQSLDMENEKLILEILDTISKVDENIANDLLKNFLDKVGVDNVSEDFRTSILESTNKEDLNTYIKQAQELYDKSVEGNEEGQYKSGSKDKLLSSIKDANKINDNYFANQDDVDEMSNKLKNAIDDFEENKVKVMPANLGDSYISRLKKIERETEIKLYSTDETGDYLSNGELGGILYDAQLEYEGIINEIYNDLEQYLSSDEESQLIKDKNNYKKEKAQKEYEYDNMDPMMIGTWMVQDVPETLGNLAKDHCYDLINKYMK